MKKSKPIQPADFQKDREEERLLRLMKEIRILRVKDVRNAGIHPETLRRMHKKGIVNRISRGLYTRADATPGQHQTLLEVASRMPRAVACLLTALRFHEIGTQDPREVWIAISRTARQPEVTYPRMRVFRFSGQVLIAGIETHRIDGVEVKVYGVAKTIADCFKYRSKVGANVAVEAMKDALNRKKCTVDDLWRYARICGVTKIIQPYLEAIV